MRSAATSFGRHEALADHFARIRGDALRERWAAVATWHRTRFAPSPTGLLHLGHVAHAGWLWEVAGALGLEVVIRMEDHDRSRCRPAFESGILAELAWLGFHPEPRSLASLQGPPPSPWRQSDHPARYQVAFDRLEREGRLYGCTCTRGDLPPPGPDGERRYPGTCRGQPIDGPGRRVVRVELPDEVVTFDDLLLGPQRQHPAVEHGDPVIRDAAGQWTYQFAVVVDDLHDRIGLIVRGEDLLTSTGRQVLLGRLLGRAAPAAVLHHPLLYGADGRKLSKRDGSESVSAMRAAGMTAEEVLALAVMS